MRPTIALVTTALLSTLLLAGCGSGPVKPEQEPASVADANRTVVDPNAGKVVPVAPVAPPEGSDLAALKDPKSVLFKRSVYFDYDSFAIRDESKALIDAHGRFLAGKPKLKMLVQGNADERGSREYNVALGQKRAEALRKALALLGVKDEQVEAVSLGKEKPACSEHEEACWAKNRRADILYSGEF